ncbi:hypothetical protein J3B02_005424, partial [Coemansia erecta]
MRDDMATFDEVSPPVNTDERDMLSCSLGLPVVNISFRPGISSGVEIGEEVVDTEGVEKVV